MNDTTPSKNKRIAFFAVTGLFTLAMLPGAIGDLAQPEMVVEIMEKMGMPLYVLTLIGVWKLLGFVGLAFTSRPNSKIAQRPWARTLNEWIYAGFFFDLTGAAFSHAASGDLPGVVPPLVLLGALLGSYLLRPQAALTSTASSLGEPAMATS